MRGARQGVGQSSVNKGRTNCVTQEQSSVEGKAELRAKADKLCFFYVCSFFPSPILRKSAFCFRDAVIENPSGLVP